jgi:hypothetical protein
MPNPGTTTLKILASALLVSLASCAPPPPSEAAMPPADDTGRVVLSITNAPADATCLRITAKGATTAVRSLSLMTGASASFALDGLPSGAVQFTAEAFSVGCASVSSESVASWLSDAVAAMLVPGQVSNVALALHRPGRAKVSVDFPLSCNTSSACPTGSACVGGVCKKSDGGPCSIDADCASGLCTAGVCSSSNNCGGSGLTCATGEVCVGGACKKADGGACMADGECVSGLCSNNVCKKPNGAMCAANADCASGLCSGGVCTIPSGCGTPGFLCPAGTTCVSGVCKKPDGGMCMADNECLSGLCSNNVCKKADGAMCAANADCASGLCSGGVCTIPSGCGTPGFLCPSGTTCVGGLCKKADGGACMADSECLSGLCSANVCKKPNGATCGANPECASGVCSGGVCTVPGGCGTPGFLCPSGTTCVGTACKKVDGGQCTADSDCASGLCSNGTCTTGPNPGPALQWKFDESTGTTALDASGNGRNGTYLGTSGTPGPSTSVPSAGAPANPLSRIFVRANRQAVRLSSTPAALKPTNGLTLSAWYRATSVGTSGAEIISAGDNYVLRLRSTQIEFDKRVLGATGTGAYAVCAFAVTGHLDGAWHHLAAVSNSTGMKVYLDGVEKCTNTRGENLLYDRGPDFWVGRHGNGSTAWDFEGNIDDVRVYPRALVASEISSLFAAAQ